MKYDGLLREKGGNGFPFLVYLNAEGDVIAPHSGGRDVNAFKKSATGVKRLLAFEAKAKAGDEGAKTELFIAKLTLGGIKFTEASAQVKTLKLSDAQKAEVAPLLESAEISELADGARTEEGMAKAASRFGEMLAAGKIPAASQPRLMFFSILANAGVKAKDPKAVENVLAQFKKHTEGIDPKQVESFEKFLESAVKRASKTE